ncbi:unnamed protein product, partial [Meganyctiphanes norvegica]
QDIFQNFKNNEGRQPNAAHKAESRTWEHIPGLIRLAAPRDKISAVRERMVHLISRESKQLPYNNGSVVSIAFLAFGVILFDVLADAMFGSNTNILSSMGAPVGREALLPGMGLFGDSVSNIAEVFLNMLTVYLYRDESSDCGERLLCESNQQAVSRGFLDSLFTYVSGFIVSLFLDEAPLSQSLQAMRNGRKLQPCLEIYPNCSITL